MIVSQVQGENKKIFNVSTVISTRLSFLSAAIFFILVFVGTARIISTYPVFNQTTDEPAHIACGLEWLDRGSYIYEPLHPPLARVAVALGPFLDGIRLAESQRKYLDEIPQIFRKRYRWGWYYNNLHAAMWKEGNRILYSPNGYFRNLTLARIGIIPFFLFAAGFLWLWSRTLFGNVVALIAVGFFTSLPPILAHAGLATTDVAFTATFLCCIVSFAYWLEQPTLRRSFLFGVAGGLAILTKFSSLLFFPITAITLLVWRLHILRSTGNELKFLTRDRLFALGLSSLVALLLIWSGYRFSLNPLKPVEARPHAVIDRFVGNEGTVHDLAYSIVEASIIPARELLEGITQVVRHQDMGLANYFLGEVRTKGWWYFFPVLLAVKTPLPILFLAAIGSILLYRHSLQTGKWLVFSPVLCVLAILVASMVSNINIGIRHILPIYPFIALIAAYAVVGLWNTGRRHVLLRIIIVALCTWQLLTSAHAHPDYLAYFNELAARNPEKIVIDSDLDWGQDLQRLSTKLKEMDIDEIALAYQGTADLSRHGLPLTNTLEPHRKATGWIAISLYNLKVREGYSWLEDYKPVALVGKSIKLFYIPANESKISSGTR